MARDRYVLSFSCPTELIKDIDYYSKTAMSLTNRSRAIETVLRNAIPRRNLSTSTDK